MSPIVIDMITGLLSKIVTLDPVMRIENREALETQLDAVSPEIILVGLQPGEPDDVCTGLLGRFPWALVIALTHDGRDAYVHMNSAHRRILRDLSAQDLIAAVRAGLQDRKI